MNVFKTENFEVGLNLSAVTAEDVELLFQTMRECPDCSVHDAEIDRLADEVWEKYWEAQTA